MKKDWISKEDELPNAYEEVEVLMNNGDVHREMIIRGEYGKLEWSLYEDSVIRAWREIN